MARRGVLAWNGQGRVRFSFHGYNSRRDVDRAIDALAAEWTQ
jgi:selenocysteine lyase/cysteine desulfurase